MLINFSAKESLTWNSQDIFGKGKPSPETVQDVLQKAGISQPIKVDISKEGMDRYKEKYQQSGQDRDFKGLNIHLTPEGMVFGNEDWPDRKDFIDVGDARPEKLLHKGMDLQKWYDDWTSVKDKASMLLSAYTKAYEEIVKGYESGTRTKYRIDIDAKDLYRAVTMEEELAALEERYAAKAANLEELNRLSCSARKSIAVQYTEWAERGFLVSREEAAEKTARYRELKDEEEITDIQTKMMSAMYAFQSQYRKGAAADQ